MCSTGAAGAALSLALVLVTFGVPSAVHAQDAKLCAAPLGIDALEHPPTHIRERIAKGLPLKIVAIGSSSTLGSGREQSRGRVLSEPPRGRAQGETPRAPDHGAEQGRRRRRGAANGGAFRCRRDRGEPDLVLWQVGSNSVLRDHPAPGEILRQGVEKLKESGAEVILINPQYAPKIIAKPGIGQAVDVITATAHDEEVGLFDRFLVMRYWVDTEHMAFEQFLSPDLLHMNDWSYACVAKLLASAIADGAKPPAATAIVAPGAIKR